VVWQTNLQQRFGEDTLWWDLGTSPVLTEKAVVIAVMQTGPSYLAAFDRTTGELLWKHDRDLGAPEEAAQSYSTPVVVKGKPALGEPDEVLVVLGADHVTAHDAADGREVWRAGGLNPTGHKYFRSIASPVVTDTLVIAPYARGATITAIRRGGSGDVTGTHVAWARTDIGADVPTPAASGTMLVVCSDNGRLECLDAASGRTLARTELAKNRHAYSASPVVVDGAVIVTREDGESQVLALPGRQGGPEPFAILGTGVTGEMTVATACLDDLALPPCGFIKIDVEGHEAAVLRGASRLIARDRPVLLIELEQRHTGEPIEASLQAVMGMGYAASFLRDGVETPIAGFDPDADHRGRADRPGYVFNFIFRPV
jgi:FkbM family methyltransferase